MIADPETGLGRQGISCSLLRVNSPPVGCSTPVVMATASNVTAVWARALPFTVAPVWITIAVISNMVPLKSEDVPRVVWPATCQKMFLA